MAMSELQGWLLKSASQMRNRACVVHDNHKYDLNAFAKDIETAAEIAEEDEEKYRKEKAQLRKALLTLWSEVGGVLIINNKTLEIVLTALKDSGK